MARTKAIQFEDLTDRLEAVRDAMKATDEIRLYIRYQCIHLYLSGESRNRIAEILILTLETIGNYIRAYCSGGLEGLANMNWNSGMIGQWIEKQFQVKYSERGTRELLYRLGFSFTRPTYTLAKADPERQKAFIQDFDGLKKIASSRNCSDSV